MTDDILKHYSAQTGIVSGECLPDDHESEILSLRPDRLSDYVGQDEVVETLKIAREVRLRMESDIMLFFTGRTRESSKIAILRCYGMEPPHVIWPGVLLG